MEQRHNDEMMFVLDEKLNNRTFDSRAVFLFGHCNATEEMADYLIEKSVKPIAILDNSVSKQECDYRGMPIISPESIQSYNAENSIVLIATRFFAEMKEQLRCIGYDGEIVQVAEYNSFAEYSLSEDTIIRKKARMLRGAGMLEGIRERYPKQHLVVCPYNALGDVYRAMAFLPAYCKKNGVDDFAVVVIGNGCRQVAELFGAKKIVVLEHPEMDELVQALVFTREENCIIAHHDRPYTDNIIKYLDKYFLSFIDYYCCAVFGLPKGTAPTMPRYMQPFIDEALLIKDKTVIIAPYAKSVVQPPQLFWEDLAGQWQNKGYLVLTSVTGGEKPINGTAGISIAINQMIAAVEYAGVFIGLRSGLCDVIVTANCRKLVVFSDCCYSTTPHKIEDFFALPGWEKILHRGNCSEGI